jgi:excisionase family DNA binding protein
MLEGTMDEVVMLRPAQAAALLGLSLHQLRGLAAGGRLVTMRTLGGHRRYREDDVVAVVRWMTRPAHDGGGHGGVPRPSRSIVLHPAASQPVGATTLRP